MSSPSRVGSIDPTTFGLVPSLDILSSSQGYVHFKLAYMGVIIIIIIIWESRQTPPKSLFSSIYRGVYFYLGLGYFTSHFHFISCLIFHLFILIFCLFHECLEV